MAIRTYMMLSVMMIMMMVAPVTMADDDIQVEYFVPAVLECDNSNLNITTDFRNRQNIQAKYWILPSGQKIDNTSVAEIQKGEVAWMISDWLNFNLTVTKVNDEDFGVYYCVIVRNNYEIDVVRKGLNVDGPDFSKLLKRYRHNAMVGGIAAAVLFVIVCGSCMVYHFRYGPKKAKERKEGLELDFDKHYDNAAVEVDDMKNGTNTKYTADSERL